MLFRQGNRLINSRNWAKLVRPEQIVCDSDPNDTMYGKFTYEPLERGYGVTIGNALRRYCFRPFRAQLRGCEDLRRAA